MGLLEALLRPGEALVAGVAVGGGGHDVGQPLPVQGDHQLLLHLHGGEAAPGLGEAAALAHRAAHDGGEPLVGREALVELHRLLQVDLGAGRPAGQVLPAHLQEALLGNAGIADRLGNLLTPCR